MIVTSSERDLAAGSAAAVQWTSLARRGMLWSDVQVFDVTVMAARARGPELDRDCHELLYCARGAVTIAAAAGESATLRLLAGQCVVLAPSDDAVRVTACGRGATLIRLRSLPVETAKRLPGRQPSLDDRLLAR